MASVTLTQLRARVREAADMTGDTFVTDAADSLDNFINEGLDALYDLIVAKFEDDYVAEAAISLAAGDTSEALPADFYKLRLVEFLVGTEYVTADKFTWRERNYHRNLPAYQGSAPVPRYRLMGGYIQFAPAAASALTGVLWYTPARTRLVSGSDAVNFPGGWERYAICWAAIACRIKEETDTSELERKMALIQAQIEAAAMNRDAGAPARTTDVQLPFYGREGF